LLSGERTALNFLQHLSGIATFTAKFVEQVKGTKAKILDTRKTTPGLRLLEKYAVQTGGGHNHRIDLRSAVMVKDNHLAAIGSIKTALQRLRTKLPIVVEAQNLKQLESALAAGARHVLLDNMSPAQLKKAVRIARGRARLEASGGVSLKNVRTIARTGVDFISVGALTHSAAAVDISLECVSARNFLNSPRIDQREKSV
jgi:nicotinate-nucleotide pyrophosphorylase (carboxylating)